jgi:hypothetical protein
MFMNIAATKTTLTLIFGLMLTRGMEGSFTWWFGWSLVPGAFRRFSALRGLYAHSQRPRSVPPPRGVGGLIGAVPSSCGPDG